MLALDFRPVTRLAALPFAGGNRLAAGGARRRSLFLVVRANPRACNGLTFM
ncbi:hypothetical protein MFUM_480024 [Methylacidiphilum fumariolicum SolV]|uniref:Uncharacterized protein n=2 Tax=Candidatus Methylacidiphilum fumarolicum TaxID=591154 RepID=I0JY88_METFB|nr:conserved protein of unknown function [Candidatus Methylacidiphilum fumarolicum]CCG92207.1 hypothetical protein MFUM_480024 [Methylacidiphilum fumariolicum SolV]